MAMAASTISQLPLFQIQAVTLRRVRNAHSTTLCHAHAPKRALESGTSDLGLRSRRQAVLFLTATAILAGSGRSSMAQDIPLFGLRKKLKKAEEEAEEIVREGFEATERGIETAERGIETAERGIETAEREIEAAVSFVGSAQAAAVAGAEVAGVLVATGIVNGILGQEA